MSKKAYQAVNANPAFDQLETEILAYWQKNQIFEKSVYEKSSTSNYIFYDGPPFANGLPHYGHLLTGYVKDTVARYQTMIGNKVERRFGWDCHGLPAEMQAEKDLSISGRQDIMNFGIDRFNAQCRSSVLKYTNEWQEYVTRQGRWVDFENDYKTMDVNFMESVIWAFSELYKKGLVYKSHRVMPYSWACETPLSNFETRLDNSYRQRADKAITVKFKLKEIPESVKEMVDNCYILAWTTTPWTLPSNLALAINPSIDYVYVVVGKDSYIIAKSSLAKYENELSTKDSFGTVNPAELVNKNYEPLFNYFKGHENAFRILAGEFVTEGDGTGVVHLAPGFGEDDQILCEKNGIELVCPVDSRGRFTDEVNEYKDIQVFDANDQIIIALKNKNLWLKTEQYLHNYPHCWRTDTPLIYRAVPSWYVEVTKFKDRMVELNQEINWIPTHIKDGQFGKWLENARDWSISRNRFWGTPIPVWESDDPRYPRIEVYGSIEELRSAFGVEISDLHRPFIDELMRPNPDDPTGKSMMRRVPDVFDCWFESGSMPYGQSHYPFENREQFEKNFPADFIVEYVAQTRGWFYTLMVLSTALFDRPPFKNCICHGVILDAAGQKLSKRLNNYANPIEIFKLYGTDALRFFMLSSHVLKGNDLLIDKDANMVKDTLRLTIKPLWSAYNFFVLYANADGIMVNPNTNSLNLMDQYIISKLKVSILNIKDLMDIYEISAACEIVNQFLDVLNNWYIRRNRARFWSSEINDDKIAAYDTLSYVLENLVKAVAPLLPFIAEEIYLGLLKLNKETTTESVHLQEFPRLSDAKVDVILVKAMDQVQVICSSALSVRNSENLKIRLPLQSVSLYGKDLDFIDNFSDIIKDELNVKELFIYSDLSQVADHKLKINFKSLGKRLPNMVKDIIAAANKNHWSLNKAGNIEIAGIEVFKNEFELLLQAKDKIGTVVTPENNVLIKLDINLTEELKAEGLARDLVRMIQQARKDHGLQVSDHINLIVMADGAFLEAVGGFTDYIARQTLASIQYSQENSHKAWLFDSFIEEFAVHIWFEKK
jgi:isoleucyl-tRNA synthetase